MRWFTAQRAAAALLLLVLIVGAGNILATRSEIRHNNTVQQQEQAAQQRQGQMIEARLCTTLHKLAGLKPPAGNPATNPSRRYLDREHATFAQIGRDLACSHR